MSGAQAPASASHARPTRTRTELSFCEGCGGLCAHVPNIGWRHLLVITDNPTAAPYAGFQTDGDGCDPRRVAAR